MNTHKLSSLAAALGLAAAALLSLFALLDGPLDIVQAKWGALHPLWTEDFSAPISATTYYTTATTGSGLVDNGSFLLTQNTTEQRGRIFHRTPLAMTAFTTTFRFYLGSNDDGADGLAFLFCPSYDYPTGWGSTLDASCPDGYLVGFDTYEGVNGADPDRIYVAHGDTDSAHRLASVAVSNLEDGQWHTATIHFDAPLITVTLDGGGVITGATLPGYIPFVGYFGFGAGTGGRSNEQRLDDITLSAAHDAAFSPPTAEQEGWHDAPVVYTETLYNLTGGQTSFTLTVTGNAWTTTLSLANTGPIPNGEAITFTVTVTIPKAPQQEEDTVTVRAVSADGTHTATAVLTTTVSPCYVRLDDVSYPTVQAAVDASTHATDTIKVAGYCRGVHTQSGVGTVQMVYLDKSLTIQGGYTPTNWTTPDPEANPTTLDAEGAGHVFLATGNINVTLAGLRTVNGAVVSGGDNTYGYKTGGNIHIREQASVVITRCYIADGRAEYDYSHGGGIAVNGATLYLYDSTVTGNRVSRTVGDTPAGGGIWIHNSKGVLKNNDILTNTAGVGGGVWSNGWYLMAEGNTFRGNSGSAYHDLHRDEGGGGLFVAENGDVIIRNNTFITNTAKGIGGALLLKPSSFGHSLTLASNRFVDNHADQDGGAVRISIGCGYGYSCHHLVQGNTIVSNTASGNGGGVALSGNDDNMAVIEENLISGNRADNCGGGLYYKSNMWPTLLAGNRIVSNTAQTQGGGLCVEDSRDLQVVNNVIADNQTGGGGGGLYYKSLSYATRPSGFLHNTFARNGGASGIFLQSGGGANQVVFTNTVLVSHTVGITTSSGMTATLNRVLWFDNGTDSGGAVFASGVVTGNPAFAADGYHITGQSAALDEGAACGVDDDIDGQPRPMFLAPDLGADEYAPHVDVALRKTRESSATLLGGDAISFTLTLSASAASELAPDVQVVDAVAPASAAAAIAGQTVNGTCSGAGATLTCTLYSVPTETVRTVTVWMTTTQDFAGVFTNTAAATVINAEDTNAGNNAGGPVTATVLAKQPDLWVTKTGPEYIAAGATFDYLITWGNGGNLTATAAVLSDTLPSEVTFVSATPTQSSGPNPLVWNLGSVAPGAGGTVTVTVRVPDDLLNLTVLTNTAVISGAEAEWAVANNIAVFTTTVHDLGGYDFRVTKQGSTDEVEVGDEFYYDITIENTGERAAWVTMEDAIPAGLEFDSDPAPSASWGDISFANGKVTWTGYMEEGVGVAIRFHVKVIACDGVSCGVIQNVAEVTVPDVTYVWKATAETHVSCPDLTVELSGPRYVMREEGAYVVFIHYRNDDSHLHPAPADDVELSLAFDINDEPETVNPPYTRLESNPATGQAIMVWEVGTLAAGQEGDMVTVIIEDKSGGDHKDVYATIRSTDPLWDECDDHRGNNDDLMDIWWVDAEWSKKSSFTYNVLDNIIRYNYYLRFKYTTRDPAKPPLKDYTINDAWPQEVVFQRWSSWPPLKSTQRPVAGGHNLVLDATTPLLDGRVLWVQLSGEMDAMNVQAGAKITNSATISGNIGNDTIGDYKDVAVDEVPLMPPLITYPWSGEICPGEVTVRGIAQPNTAIWIVDAGDPNRILTYGQSDNSGAFAITIDLRSSQSIRAVAVNNDDKAFSQVVSLEVTDSYWAPQRSYWEGIAKAGAAQGTHIKFNFVGSDGLVTSSDWQLSGVYGFWDTNLYLNECRASCPNDTLSFEVTADGKTYTPITETNLIHSLAVTGVHHFRIGSAHDVSIKSCCGDDCREDEGEVLIDPDGFVFDVDAGGDYSGPGGMFNPVQSISGVTVTCYVSMPEWGGWVPWPAHLYDQVNPQNTNATYSDGITTTGYFAFFTPPGHYYLDVEGIPGYQHWRSPVVEVITQIVHVNVPYTPWPDTAAVTVTLTSDGSDPAVVTVPVGSAVQWLSTLRSSDTITDLVQWSENPILRPLSERDPLLDVRGFDAGYLEPGRVYRRRFAWAGEYPYSDAAGHTGLVKVVATEDCIPLVDLQVSGPSATTQETAATLVAAVNLLSGTAQMPVLYTWQATEQPEVSRQGGLTDTQVYTWTTAGVKAITVTASNPCASVLTETHTVTVAHRVYLPLMLRNS